MLQCVAVCCSVSYMCSIFCMRPDKVLSVRIDGVFKTQLRKSVAVCCSVLQCVAVCCSVLPSVAACCSVSYMFGTFCMRPDKVLSVRIVGIVRMQAHKSVAVCCSVLQCVAVCCSVLKCVAVC